MKDFWPQKRLHLHSLPIIVLGLTLLGISLASFSTYSRFESVGGIELGRDLTKPFMHVRPMPDGIAQINYGAADDSRSPQAVPGINQAGQSARLTIQLLSLGSSAKQ